MQHAMHSVHGHVILMPPVARVKQRVCAKVIFHKMAPVDLDLAVLAFIHTSLVILVVQS